jgi:hypothetical protein
MTGELYPGSPQAAESLLQEEVVQEKLRVVFAELDNLYAGINEHTPYERKSIAPAAITPSGTFIEASTVALPLPEGFGDDDARRAKVAAHHASKEYVIFAFNLEELKDPNFALRPLDLTTAQITHGRGNGIDIFIPDGTPEPIVIKDAESARIAAAIKMGDDMYNPQCIHLPQTDADRIKYHGEPTEDFRDVRQRAGVEL